MRHLLLTALIGLAALLTSAASAQVQQQISLPPYPITTPEPWLPPKYQSPRGSTEHVVTPPPAPTPQHGASVPPSLYVPQTGRVLPNLPNPAPSGPHGSETAQDRAARCAHQAGAYGAQAGNSATYLGSCINQ
jgi:acyl transferase domain-containing protein